MWTGLWVIAPVLVMFGGVFAATLLLSLWPTCYDRWPMNLRAHPVAFGLLLALGFVAGEWPNSFLKRQLDIAPGGRRMSALGIALSIFDQADYHQRDRLRDGCAQVMDLTRTTDDSLLATSELVARRGSPWRTLGT